MNRIVIAAAALLLLASCREPAVRGKGPEKTEQRSVAGTFSRIKVDAAIDAHITVGGAPSLSITGQENMLSYVESKVENGTLHISMKEGNFYTDKNLVANITLPSLEGLEVAGSGDATISGNVTGAALKIETSGSGDVQADRIDVGNLEVDLSGSSTINIRSGNTARATYSIAGSGDIDAFGLQTGESAVDIAGSGDAKVTATSKLSIDIAGSGDVSYKGHPALTQSIAGSGDINDAN